jgi:hypothetical protein
MKVTNLPTTTGSRKKNKQLYVPYSMNSNINLTIKFIKNNNNNNKRKEKKTLQLAEFP